MFFGGRAAVAEDADRLVKYRSMRRADRTPEPVPAAGIQPQGNDDTFVIQEHHARRLHWDLRLERNGVLVSWAVPRGVPTDVAHNRLAVHTEDHPLEYATFSGSIPRGEYGGGDMFIWDAGTYETEKWRDDEVIVVLHGEQAQGRYALIQTGGTNWLLHRMKDQSPEPHDYGPGVRVRPVPAGVHPPPATRPALGPRVLPGADLEAAGDRADAGCSGDRGRRRRDRWWPGGVRGRPSPPRRTGAPRRGRLVPSEHGGAAAGWRFEAKWDGIRAIAAVAGGAVSLRSRAGNDLTASYPELAELGELLAEHAVVLDGEIVALGRTARRTSARCNIGWA